MPNSADDGNSCFRIIRDFIFFKSLRILLRLFIVQFCETSYWLRKSRSRKRSLHIAIAVSTFSAQIPQKSPIPCTEKRHLVDLATELTTHYASVPPEVRSKIFLEGTLGPTLSLQLLPALSSRATGLMDNVPSKLHNCAVTTKPFVQWNLILAHLQHSEFNIVYISRGPCNASPVVHSHGCAIAYSSLKETFAQCKIFLEGTLHYAKPIQHARTDRVR